MRGESCRTGEWQLFGLPSLLVHDCSTCSLSSAGRASNTERSTLDKIRRQLEACYCLGFVLPVRHFTPVLTCEGEGTSILKLRRVRECFGVCLHAGCSLLVPGTGSAGDKGYGAEFAVGTVVEEVVFS